MSISMTAFSTAFRVPKTRTEFMFTRLGLYGMHSTHTTPSQALTTRKTSHGERLTPTRRRFHLVRTLPYEMIHSTSQLLTIRCAIRPALDVTLQTS